MDFAQALYYDNVSSKAKITFKDYSSKNEFDSGSIELGGILPNYNIELSQFMLFYIFNYKVIDITIQYVNI